MLIPLNLVLLMRMQIQISLWLSLSCATGYDYRQGYLSAVEGSGAGSEDAFLLAVASVADVVREKGEEKEKILMLRFY